MSKESGRREEGEEKRKGGTMWRVLQRVSRYMREPSTSAQLLQKENDTLRSLLSSKDAMHSSTESRLREMLSSKDDRLRSMDDRLHSMLSMKDKYVELVKHAFHKELSRALYENDVVWGRVSPKYLLEASVCMQWMNSPTTAYGRPIDISLGRRLQLLLAEGGKEGVCPGLLCALRQAAKDNNVEEEEVVLQARRLYEVLSEHVHTEQPEGPSQHSGRPTLVAFATLVHFSGRDVSLYYLGGPPVTVKLRALRRDHSATAEKMEQAEWEMVKVRPPPEIYLHSL